MTQISTAVDVNRVSAITGYEVKASLAGIQAGNLPQRLVILGQKSTANEGSTVTQLDATSAQEVGDEYGYGSQLYAAARILRPQSGDKLGGIPTVFIPVAEPGGATATTLTWAITGTATKTVTHYLKINGRTQLDGTTYSFVVEKDETAVEISQKMIDAANAALGCPVIGTLNVNDAVFTSGWKGLSSADIDMEIFTNGDAAGISYALTKVDGAGAVSITSALAEIGDKWATQLVNCFGSDSDILDALEDWNGNPNDKTGRYDATVFKPLVAYFGDNAVNTLALATANTDSRKDAVTNVFCPAPNSKGMDLEAAANVAFLYAPIVQNEPNKDPIGQLYPDMPFESADGIGDFADPSKRDQIVKIGSSTVTVSGDTYKIIDLVTTSHPDNEPQTAVLFRWVRDLVGVDWNMRYAYMLLEEAFLVGKTIIDDDALTSNPNTMSEARWKGILVSNYGPDLVSRALMANLTEFEDSIQVQKGTSNPNRFETSFTASRTGVIRVSSTTNNTKFNFNI